MVLGLETLFLKVHHMASNISFFIALKKEMEENQQRDVFKCSFIHAVA